MALSVIVLAVEENSHVGRFSIKVLPSLTQGISCIGGELSHTEICPFCDKEQIKKTLICWSDKNEDNIIILCGNTIAFPTLSDIAYEIIKEIIDNNICDELNTTLSELTEKLQHSFDRPICGIRKQTLILNMCGSYTDAIICLKTNSALILQIICLTNVTEESSCNNKDSLALDDNDNTDALCDNNNPDASCDNPDEELMPPNEETKDSLMSMGIYKKQNQSVILSLTAAINKILSILRVNEEKPVIEVVKTNNAYGRILAEDIFSKAKVPSYTASTKHGYAVLASAGKGVRRVLRADLPFAEISIEPGTCARVRSGTPIPKGATAVVKLEDTKIIEENDDNDDDYFNINDKEYEIEVLIDPKEKANIRNAGCEIRHSQGILGKYLRIGPAELGILTLCGIDSVRVVAVPSVGLLSIGDELMELGNPKTFPLPPGHIYDSNRITLISLLKKNDFDPVDFGISAYRITDILNRIEDALNKVDIIVTMGHSNDKDILKPILTNYFNAVFYFGRLNIKPGKSTAFASCKFNHKTKYFVCMSANPATVPIVAHLVLLPLLNEIHRNYRAITTNLMSCVKTSYKLHSRPKFSWTNLEWTENENFPRAHCLRNSHYQNTMRYSKANALLMLPSRTMYESIIEGAFLPAMFYG